MDKQPQSRAPLIVTIVLLPVLYVGSYFALVVLEGRTFRVNSCVSHIYFYRVNWDFVPTFYGPVARIDQRLRSAAWYE